MTFFCSKCDGIKGNARPFIAGHLCTCGPQRITTDTTTFRKDDHGESLDRSTTNRITGSNARSGAEMPVGSGAILTIPV